MSNLFDTVKVSGEAQATLDLGDGRGARPITLRIDGLKLDLSSRRRPLSEVFWGYGPKPERRP